MIMNLLRSLFKKSLFAEFDSNFERAFSISIRGVKFNSYFEAIRWHGAFKHGFMGRQYYNIWGNKLNLEDIIENELYNGSMIIFPSDENVIIDKNSFINIIQYFFKSNIKSILNEISVHEKLSAILNDFDTIKGYSLGNLFNNKYYDVKAESNFNENSFAIEIIDIPSDILIIVAVYLSNELNQRHVLVHDGNNGRIILVTRKERNN